MEKEIRVGLVGYKFMGRAHSNAYLKVTKFFDLKLIPRLRAVCGRNEEEVKNFAEKFGWETYETSWEKLVERDDIDLIDISTPGDTHAPIAIAAAKKGKHIICEKPLANTLQQAKEMVKAVEKAKVKHMVAFNYRRVPAVCLAKKLIDEGRIGKIYHFRAVYLQDWIVDPDFPLVWRLKKEKSGSGAHGDLNAHIIDLARFLVGEISEVSGIMQTFIKERPILEKDGKISNKKGKVTVDDATLFVCRFKNGAVGSFEATRFATGRKNYNHFEINGSEGSIVFNLERLNELEFYSRKEPQYLQGFKTILTTESVHPYISNWWPPGHIIGWEHTFVHEVYDFLQCIAEDKLPVPNFYDGLECQKVLDAVEKSAKEKRWVKV
jgi:predicted dehydrogenase